MKSGFYFKTARINIVNNYRFYVPQMLTGTGLLASFYIVLTLAMDERMKGLKGGSVLPIFMTIGGVVIALLSAILILYTNSFLMKQRKREYGLYNVLGMEKKHIGKIVFFETLITSAVSIVLGLILGVAFYKLCSLFICKLLKSDVILGFDFINPQTIILSGLLFAVLYALTYVFNRLTIARMTPATLLKSTNEGEREPKVKIPVLVLGIAALTLGYVISVVTTSPLKALFMFFTAVFLVIIGTYCLFTAGSVFVLKCMKKSKKFYYGKKHMTTVSGLLYRMKQNAVGLASICLLATGVLVMISSTVSLYSGMQDTIELNYPDDMYVFVSSQAKDGTNDPFTQELIKEAFENASNVSGLKIAEPAEQKYISVVFDVKDGEARCDYETAVNKDVSPSAFTFMTAEAYGNFGGNVLNLSDDEIAICTVSNGPKSEKTGKTLTINGKTYKIVQKLSGFPVKEILSTSFATYGAVVANDNVLEDIYEFQKKAYGENASELTRRLAVNFIDKEAAEKDWPAFNEAFYDFFTEYFMDNHEEVASWTIGSEIRWESEESMLSLYGGFLFLGIILGTVCMFATVLIIYYKQISEGYEDRGRYQIMKKVGMSDEEIRSSVRSQTLTVFFLPLVFAGIHTAFAFPIINRMLHLLLLSDTKLFVICSLVSYAVFAVVYVIIYGLTAKTYYKIVR